MKKELQNLDYCQKAIDLKKDIEGSFLTLGEYLYQIRENQKYEPQWSSFSEYIYELKISPNMANKLIQIYTTFILSYGFSPDTITNAGGWSTLAEILPMISSKKEALRWLVQAQQLTREDLRKEIALVKNTVNPKNTKKNICGLNGMLHKYYRVYRVCQDCGKKEEVFIDKDYKILGPVDTSHQHEDDPNPVYITTGGAYVNIKVPPNSNVNIVGGGGGGSPGGMAGGSLNIKPKSLAQNVVALKKKEFKKALIDFKAIMADEYQIDGIRPAMIIQDEAISKPKTQEELKAFRLKMEKDENGL